MQSAARFPTRRSHPARRWARWLLVLLLPWLLSGLGQSVLHSANCPDVLVLHSAVAASDGTLSGATPSDLSSHSDLTHDAGHHAHATQGHADQVQTLSAAVSGSDELCLTSLWATQAIGMQVATVPLILSARVTTPFLRPVFLVSAVALPRNGLIRGPPVASALA